MEKLSDIGKTKEHMNRVNTDIRGVLMGRDNHLMEMSVDNYD
jgi:hypothetical protein